MTEAYVIFILMVVTKLCLYFNIFKEMNINGSFGNVVLVTLFVFLKNMCG